MPDDNADSMLISDTIKDEHIRNYLYLDCSLDDLIEKMNGLTLTDIGNNDLAPFNAKVRGYTGACDEEGNPWLVKSIPPAEGPAHKIQEMAYYMDFLLKTPAAPTILLQQDGVVYRTTKHIQNAMQISSYNYLDKPFVKMIANDLINRWLFFDEDRNPNNYLVKHDTDSKPYIIVIDYNKADLETESMKIFGTEEKFGWHREEKTRFLTLLKPDNFEKFRIDDFSQRLELLMSIPEEQILAISRRVFSCDCFPDTETVAKKITANLCRRRDYINEYFRKWFKERDIEKEKEVDDRYAGMGESFLKYYKDKT